MKLFIKGVLFYVTSILAILFVASIDSLYENNALLPAIGILSLLIYLCKKYISEKEMNILLLENVI